MATLIFVSIVVVVYTQISEFEASSNKNNTHQNNGFTRNVSSVRFLVTVNDTWDPNGCIATVLTQPLQPNKHHKQGDAVDVGGCDHGPLDFSVSAGSNSGYSKMTVNVVFYSSVIMDASHPSCDIEWNGTYLVPTKEADQKESLLPGCFVMDSREGYHMTYYWFHILDWNFA